MKFLQKDKNSDYTVSAEPYAKFTRPASSFSSENTLDFSFYADTVFRLLCGRERQHDTRGVDRGGD